MISSQFKIDPDTWIAPNATICGAIEIGPQTNIWFGAVVRGDLERIQIGRCCNIQDGAVLHCDGGEPTVLEDYVTIGHKAIVHSAHLERGCLIGMGAIVMNGVRIGAGSIVGAGAIVTKSVQPHTLAIGTPARPRRTISPEEVSEILSHAEDYWTLAIAHRQGKFPLVQGN